MMRSSVLLPVPLPPMTPILAPGKKARVMFLMTSRLLYALLRRSRVRMYCSGMGVAYRREREKSSGYRPRPPESTGAPAPRGPTHVGGRGAVPKGGAAGVLFHFGEG